MNPAPLTTDLRSFNNQWYQPGPRWKIILWFLVNPLTLNSYAPLPVALKRLILRSFGAKIGRGVMIKPRVNVKYPWLLDIGEYAWVGEGVWIDNLVPVRVGPHACLSQGALLLTGNHDYTRTTFDLKSGVITLEAGVWIGANAVVGPGVTCHSHAVLAVGSVATRSLDAYGIYRGNPAEFVRRRIITT
ncbi:MAG: colanic acid biosynthesis acetyltransferase WcaF [Sphingobacteriaceae bacterium]|nr:colanic acid biosynthesis acetyltransferase WcaF [Cytophagaceae bacterium]